MWGFIPELLREHDYNLLAAVVFLLLPVAFFELAYRYNSRQKAKREGPVRRLQSISSAASPQGPSRRIVLDAVKR